MFSNKYYVGGDQNVQVPAHLNFGKYILDRMRAKKNKIAIKNMDTEVELSYNDVTQYAVNLATSLINLGVEKGDTVALGTEIRIEFIPVVLGIVFTGATYTTYELNSGLTTLKHKLNLTKPKYFICSKIFYKRYEDIIKSYDCIKTIITLDDSFENLISVKDLVKENVDVELFEPAKVKGQTDVAFILYSSGTTGMSKGVELTHLNCILNSLPEDFSDNSLNTCFMHGEWYHNYDTFMTYKFFALGRKIFYSQDRTIQNFLDCVHKYQMNIAFLTPTFVNFLSKEENLDKYNLDSLRIIYSRSSPLHKKTIDNVKQKFANLKEILQGYGMTEAGELTSESWGHKGPKTGSVGKPSPGIILKVSDLNTSKTLGPNERGEIRLKGPVLMKGYIGMDLSKDLDEEGFFKTGDLGYYDEDNYFYIVGRLKEIISYVGFKIAPLDLETILQLHPGVRQAAVVGKPDPDYIELPTAFVVKQNGYKVTEHELFDYVAKEVPPYMQLKGGVRFIEELPKNARGKILKQNLKNLLTEN